ncbi:DUF4345 family protein [Rhodococcus tibetensis]|uniref:DUF4345 domain-containing protein n=1 Tax=Rhodococcus tibetensis TaxID=2965064 RepID=A0ABT1Q8Y5_9NOCA|nr:DUF4345 family protein [Rhodococcus sp. FXJ9.536]MCQ4118706.1 DUF4345 domain-containing protein [Rhodococcus sp. FXJ9.536]
MAAFLIIVAALFFAGMGLYGLVMPARLVEPFGLTAASPTARAEVRAVYGGFGVAVAALLGFAAFDAQGVRSVVAVAVGVALVGMAAGRVVSGMVDRPQRFYPVWFYFVVELVLAGLLAWAAAIS